jgi:protein phosphatase
MGGHQAGELASKLAIEAISKPIPDVVTESAAIEMLHEANRSIFQAMRAGIGRPAMGTTLVGASIRSDRCVIFNIGDSRAYLLRTQVLRQVSKDHVPQVETGRRRSHAVTQALGGLRTEGPISPHTHSFTLDPDDTILLCSDGLTDMISDDEITAVLKSSKSDPAKDLVEAALEAGGHDNITVVVIRPH